MSFCTIILFFIYFFFQCLYVLKVCAAPGFQTDEKSEPELSWRPTRDIHSYLAPVLYVMEAVAGQGTLKGNSEGNQWNHYAALYYATFSCTRLHWYIYFFWWWNILLYSFIFSCPRLPVCSLPTGRVTQLQSYSQHLGIQSYIFELFGRVVCISMGNFMAPVVVWLTLCTLNLDTTLSRARPSSFWHLERVDVRCNGVSEYQAEGRERRHRGGEGRHIECLSCLRHSLALISRRPLSTVSIKGGVFIRSATCGIAA